MCSAAMRELIEIHRQSNHHSVRCTIYIVKRIAPSTSRVAVKDVVRKCLKYQSIDPIPTRWQSSKLEVRDTWTTLGMDIIHYRKKHYLALINCRPTCFLI